MFLSAAHLGEQYEEIERHALEHGIGVFLISLDIHDIFDRTDRLAAVENIRQTPFAAPGAIDDLPAVNMWKAARNLKKSSKTELTSIVH